MVLQGRGVRHKQREEPWAWLWFSKCHPLTMGPSVSFSLPSLVSSANEGGALRSLRSFLDAHGATQGQPTSN